MGMENAISGLVISLLTQGAKRLKGVPITDAQKFRIRGLMLVLSSIGALGIAYLDGTLLQSNAIDLVGSSLTNYIFAILSYYGFLK